MVEALVALVVLSVGMLGVASLFVVTMHSGSSSISRMQAVSLATDIADRIRANRFAGYYYTVNGTAADAICTGAAANCTPQQMAANDTYLWQQQITSTFPGGAATGTIACAFNGGPCVAGSASTTPSTYTITITWVEQGNPQPSSYAMQIQAPTS